MSYENLFYSNKMFIINGFYNIVKLNNFNISLLKKSKNFFFNEGNINFTNQVNLQKNKLLVYTNTNVRHHWLHKVDLKNNNKIFFKKLRNPFQFKIHAQKFNFNKDLYENANKSISRFWIKYINKNVFNKKNKLFINLKLKTKSFLKKLPKGKKLRFSRNLYEKIKTKKLISKLKKKKNIYI